MPISARPSLAKRLEGLRAACDAVGRDFAEMEFTVMGATDDPAGIEQLASEGIQRVALTLQASKEVVGEEEEDHTRSDHEDDALDPLQPLELLHRSCRSRGHVARGQDVDGAEQDVDGGQDGRDEAGMDEPSAGGTGHGRVSARPIYHEGATSRAFLARDRVEGYT